MNARERQAAADIASYVRGWNDAIRACQSAIETDADLPEPIPEEEAAEDAVTIDAEQAVATLQALIDLTGRR